MFDCDRTPRPRISRIVLATLGLVIVSPLRAAPANVARISVLGRLDPALVRVVNDVVPRAAEMLRVEKCRQILSEYRDRTGRTLDENVVARGETASGYLRWLVFVNAADDGFCAREARVAATNPGDRLIRLCAPFQRIGLSDPGYAAALLIHEELHSLGLGENPPSSYEITRKVVERCGR
jgi:hypothetical protein